MVAVRPAPPQALFYREQSYQPGLESVSTPFSSREGGLCSSTHPAFSVFLGLLCPLHLTSLCPQTTRLNVPLDKVVSPPRWHFQGHVRKDSPSYWWERGAILVHPCSPPVGAQGGGGDLGAYSNSSMEQARSWLSPALRAGQQSKTSNTHLGRSGIKTHD